MASFSASEVALTGFRIVRERPKVILVWSVIQLVISLVFGVATVQFGGAAMMRLSAGGAGASDPAQNMALVQQALPLYFCFFVFALVFYPLLFATMNRAVLRPGDDRLGYIRLGADELRQLGLFALIFVLGLVAYIGLIIAMIVVAGVGFAVSGGSKGLGGPAALMLVLLGLAVLGLWVFVWVRLSLASPLTFATGKINLFGSWGLTKGLFWPMFGAYVVATILGVIVSLLTVVITLAVTAVLGGGTGGLATLFRPDMTSVAAYLTPARIVTLVIGAVSSALVWPVLVTPAAAIYRSLPGSVGEMDAASAFD